MHTLGKGCCSRLVCSTTGAGAAKAVGKQGARLQAVQFDQFAVWRSKQCVIFCRMLSPPFVESAYAASFAIDRQEHLEAVGSDGTISVMRAQSRSSLRPVAVYFNVAYDIGWLFCMRRPLEARAMVRGTPPSRFSGRKVAR